MVFFTEEWFWRGTQSAIFYYVSCTPWVEYKHKRKRRKDAEIARREKRNATINTQPGFIEQPAPFQTNHGWGQEILAGPGPPKGWQKDPLYYKHMRKTKREDPAPSSTRSRGGTDTSTASPPQSDLTAVNSTTYIPDEGQLSLERAETVVVASSENLPEPEPPPSSHPLLKPMYPFDGISDAGVACSRPSSFRTANRANTFHNDLLTRQSPGPASIASTGSKRSSFESAESSEVAHAAPRPSMEKRLSTAMDGFKDTMRAALHPDRWNWMRYDRDDEILPNLSEKMKSMWVSMKVNANALGEEAATKLKQLEAKETEPALDATQWQRGKHPAVNALHPPVVSQLPYSQDDAKWMLLPPASADVMMGRRRPDPFDDTKRRPLCTLGRPDKDVARQALESTALSSEEESELSENDDWLPGWSHVQKPQRAHLGR